MTHTLTQTTTVVLDFKNWLKDFTLEELSSDEAAKRFTDELVATGNLESLAYLAQQQLRQVANITARAKAKKAERESYGGIKPTIKQQKFEDIFEYVREQEYGIRSSPTPTPASRGNLPPKKTSKQKHDDAMARRANMKARLRASIDLEAEALVQDIDITDDLLNAKVRINGEMVSYDNFNYDEASARWEPWFAATTGDLEGLIFLKGIMLILKTFPGMTLREIKAAQQ